jgi:simple sugar transport system ATP-binding protein
MADQPVLEAKDVTKHFGSVDALSGVSLSLSAGEVHCLLGDNGAGKSTLIRILSGVHRPSSGELCIDGEAVAFDSPRAALGKGIATVYQDLGMIPLMSVARNFFLGREPIRHWGPVPLFNSKRAGEVTRDEMRKFGISLRDIDQPVGTLSGGERQCIAIARSVFFGARVLILDEPTSALGVTQTESVLRCIGETKARGIGVIFVTHNVRHALAVGDRFTVLSRGRTADTKRRQDIGVDELHNLMSGSR